MDGTAEHHSENIRSPKIVFSPSYAVFRSRANAAMLLDLDHMTRGEHPKHESI
jgi:hypothetical protein